MTRVEFAANRFDGVAAFYAFLHLPYGELPSLLRKVAGWLRPDGVLVATLATRHDIGSLEPAWLGVPMYFSGYAPEATRRFVEDAGLAIERLQTETILEAGRPTAFLWLVARKPADQSD
jgi:cyclopropane fatty-acyl-phospholipid synthase-like methyltransferase